MVFMDYVKCFKGSSSVTKPTSSTHLLKPCDLFFEEDSNIIYVWNGESWVILKNLNENN